MNSMSTLTPCPSSLNECAFDHLLLAMSGNVDYETGV